MNIKEIEELWEIETEDYFINRLLVLNRIKTLDTSNPVYISKVSGLSSKRLNKQPIIAKALPREFLKPDTLTKLKRNAEYSLWQDFASIGRVEVAEALIFPNKNREG